MFGDQDRPASGNHGGGRKRVTHFMQQRAADVDVVSGTPAGAIQQQRDDPVHHHAGGRDPHHHRGLNVLGMLQSPERLVEDEERNRDQRHRIDQRGQHSRAMVAVGLGGTGRARLQIHRDQRQQQSQKVGEIVSGFREQGQRVGTDASHHQQHDVGQGNAKRDFKHPLGTTRAMNVNVHTLSVRAARTGFKRRKVISGH